jgi:hypothetical protein
MRLIDAKQFRLSLLFIAVTLLLPATASYAEWILAKPRGGKNNILVDTESNRLYVSDDCAPLMQLKHLSGTKPRSLQQRQQDHFNASENTSINADQNTSSSNTNSQPDRIAVSPRDPLNLTYLSQPKFDPLNRNTFNISINNTTIALTNQHFRIKASIVGRYDRQPECGF